MNWKITIITVISIILYTYILVCCGLMGPNVQNIVLHYSLYVLKYGLILFGFFMACFLPQRIHKALVKRKEAKYEIESEKKIRELGQQKKKKEDKILQEYIKNEDAI